MPKAKGEEPGPPGDLVKNTVYLYEDEDDAVKRAARRERCSRAEIIRRAIRAYLEIA